ncbi:SRPBCC family protein [Nocardioides sp. Bht2]|uniref:SRPBCC family protein n=1 Tax=Nocardioides sp. Bht2 TaxID=3392297 RepID=UPI0039B5940B
MGLLRPLGGEVTVQIDAPPAKVWALVSDVTRIGEFSPETFEAKWTRGATGPEVGAHFAGHVKRNGVGPTYWSPCRVTRCVPEELFEFGVGTDSVAINNWGYRLRPVDGGTEVTEYFRLEPSFPVRLYWLLLGRLRGRTNTRGMETTLNAMKRVLESETGTSDE